MKKARLIIGLLLNLLILGGVAFAVVNQYFGFWLVEPATYTIFQYFTIDSNLLLAFGAFLMIIADIVALASGKYCKFCQVIKFMGVIGTTITAIITIAYLFPFTRLDLEPLARLEFYYNPGAQLYLHAIIPVLGLLSFLIDHEPRMNPFGYAVFAWVPLALYGAVIIPLVQLNIVADPYGFLYFDINGSWWIPLIWYVGYFFGAYILGVIILLFHNIGTAKKKKKAELVEEPAAPVVEEPKPEEPAPVVLPEVNEAPKPEGENAPEGEEPKPEEKPEEKPEDKKEPVTVLAPRTAYAHKKSLKPTPRTYHITKTPTGQWQVKLANGQKAIKLFATQREAIAFTKGLVESRGGSYRIHSVKGKIRAQ